MQFYKLLHSVQKFLFYMSVIWVGILCQPIEAQAQVSYNIKVPGWGRHPQGTECQYSYVEGDTLVLVDRLWGAFMYNGATGASRHATDSSISASNSIPVFNKMAVGSGALGMLISSRGGFMHLSTNRWRTSRYVEMDAMFAGNNIYPTFYSTTQGVLAFLNGKIYRTLNGIDWPQVGGSTRRNAPGEMNVKGSRVVGVTADTLYKSANYGRSFRPVACATTAVSISFVSIGDSNTTYFWCAPTVRRHVAGEAEFSTLPVPPTTGLGVEGLAFRDAAHGILTLAGDKYLYTQDSGRTWTTHLEARANNGTALVIGNSLFIRSPQGILAIDAQGNSTPRYDQVSDQSIQSLHMSRSGIGIMVELQQAYVTRNHGLGFVRVTAPTTSAILEIGYVHNDSILLVAGTQGEVFRSANFGASWVQVRQASFGFREPSQFESVANGFLVFKSNVYSQVSTDHGRTFSAGDVFGAYNLRPDGLALVLQDGRVMRNNPAVITGPNPRAIGQIPPYFSVRGGAMGDTSVGYYRTVSPDKLYKTTDGGRIWAEVPAYLTAHLGALAPSKVFRAFGADTLIVYSGGQGNYYYLTVDGGSRFDTVSFPGSILFVGNGQEAWSAGVGGGQLWYKRRVVGSVVSTSPRAAAKLETRFWPNPAQGTLRCTVGGVDASSVAAFAISGACVLRQGSLTGGQVVLHGVAPGLYQFVVKTSSGAQGTGKVVVR